MDSSDVAKTTQPADQSATLATSPAHFESDEDLKKGVGVTSSGEEMGEADGGPSKLSDPPSPANKDPEQFGSNDEKLKLQEESFDLLEQEFAKTMAELGNDVELKKFKMEYEKLHKTILKSRENERRLFSKCQELNTEMVGNAAKVQAALKSSQNDRANIVSLKKEIKSAWKTVEVSNEKETKSKEAIQQLKVELANLQKMLDQGSDMSVGQENSVKVLIMV